jgi:hypothetical protein
MGLDGDFFSKGEVSEAARGWFDSAESLAGCGKTMSACRKSNSPHVCHNRRTFPQDAQKCCPVRPQRVRGREVHTAFCVGRSPLQWVLANGKVPHQFRDPRGSLPYVEGLNDARTPLADFFSILLGAWEDCLISSCAHRETNRDLSFGLCEVAFLFQLCKIGFRFRLRG